jgi:hypothetical protein
VKNIYIDIDGVLLGTKDGRVVLANHAAVFIDFVTRNFETYWLTTHCRGTTEPVFKYLRRYAPADLLARLTSIKPTNFDVLKTEALQGDFYWLDDRPLETELAVLRSRKQFDRWIDVNTRERPDDLLFAISELASIPNFSFQAAKT